jgi:hypothetical protein
LDACGPGAEPLLSIDDPKSADSGDRGIFSIGEPAGFREARVKL